MESNIIEIPKRYNSVSNKNIIIGVLYRAPDVNCLYNSDILSAIKNENKTVYYNR